MSHQSLYNSLARGTKYLDSNVYAKSAQATTKRGAYVERVVMANQRVCLL